MSEDENPTWTFDLSGARLHYVREKLFLAIVDMAESGELQLHNRLRDAYTFNLVALS